MRQKIDVVWELDQQVQLPGLCFGQLVNCGAITQNEGKEKEQGWIKENTFQIPNTCSKNRMTTSLANKPAGL